MIQRQYNLIGFITANSEKTSALSKFRMFTIITTFMILKKNYNLFCCFIFNFLKLYSLKSLLRFLLISWISFFSSLILSFDLISKYFSLSFAGSINICAFLSNPSILKLILLSLRNKLSKEKKFSKNKFLFTKLPILILFIKGS